MKYGISSLNVDVVVTEIECQYERFWENPLAAPILWTGLLFTIMSLGQIHHHSPASLSDTTRMSVFDTDLYQSINVFQEKIVQCLILGKYTQGGPHVLETLLQYHMIEHYLHQDAEFDIWIMFGIITSISFRMGLHRDPKHFNRISVFEGEMRRRLWATIFQIDVGFSALIGLPRKINPQHCDTEEPRNLLDSDFDENTDKLPPSRSDSELTPILFLLAKSRMISVGGIIGDLTHDVRSIAYSDLMRFERLIQGTRESLPPSLKWQSLSQSIIDSPRAIMQRIYLDLFFHKMQIILYKKYLSASKTQREYQHARDVCLDSGMKILEHQYLIDEESQQDGRLLSIRWTYSSIINYDFMLAASVLCFYIEQSNEQPNPVVDQETSQKVRSLLTKSYEIWLRFSNESMEAQKAVQSLRIVLGLQHPNEHDGTENTVLQDPADHFAQINNPTSWTDYEGRDFGLTSCKSLLTPSRLYTALRRECSCQQWDL